jgi:hypothetical protein
MRRNRIFVALVATLALAGLTVTAVAIASSGQNANNGTAALVHEGPNPNTCGQTPGPNSGVVNVHSNAVQNARSVNVSVYNALPNTTYEVDIRCVGPIGFLTTNGQGTGTAHVELAGFAWPTPVFYIDILTGDITGAVGLGDVFTAGPFSAT